MIPFVDYVIIQAHPWFKGVPWDKLYDMEAAFKPEVNGELDTQNFEKFEEVLVKQSWEVTLCLVWVALSLCWL